MIRRSKALILAFLAMSAIGAVSAHSAVAVPEFNAESYPVTIHGTGANIGEKFTTEAGAVECEVSHYHGEISAHYHSTFPSTATVHPTYTGCKAFGFLSATVTTTGCDYVFHVTEKVIADYYRAHVTIECEVGKSIKITASTCAAEVKPQSLTTVDITNDTAATPKKDITVKPTVTGIKYTVTSDGFLCPFGGTGEKAGGEYSTAENGRITITGLRGTESIGIEVAGS